MAEGGGVGVGGGGGLAGSWVRYTAVQTFPQCALYNQEGLPALPFGVALGGAEGACAIRPLGGGSHRRGCVRAGLFPEQAFSANRRSESSKRVALVPRFAESSFDLLLGFAESSKSTPSTHRPDP